MLIKTTITWFDDYTTDTIKIAAKEYGLTILGQNETSNPDEIEVYVEGEKDDIARLLEDLEDGTVEPFESKRELDDNEYNEWLARELAEFGITYTFEPVEDDPEA